MVSREKIHKLLDLILDVHTLGDADCGLPFVAIEFSNYGYPIHFRSSAGGFRSEYDHFFHIRSDSDADCAISITENLLEIAKGKVGGNCERVNSEL